MSIQIGMGLGLGHAASAAAPIFLLNARRVSAGTSHSAAAFNQNSVNSRNYRSRGFLAHHRYYQGSTCFIPEGGDAGVAGALLSGVDTQLTSVLAKSPVIVDLEGGANDMASLTLQQLKDDLDAKLARIFGTAGVKGVSYVPVPPNYTLSTSLNNTRLAFNAYAVSKRSAKLAVVDIDNLGLTITDTYDSQQHLQSAGADKLGAAKYAAEIAAGWTYQGAAKDIVRTIYTTNPTLTGGTTAPTGWTLDASNAGGATATGSKVNGKWRVVLSGTYSGTACYIDLKRVDGLSGTTTGELEELVAAFDIVAAPTSVVEVAAFFQVYREDFGASLTPECLGTMAYDDQNVGLGPLGSYVARSPVVELAAPGAGHSAGVIYSSVRLLLADAVSATAVAGTFDFGFIGQGLVAAGA